VQLLPQQLYWYACADDEEKMRDFGLMDCIECGSCSFTCPSSRPLLDYIRLGKAEVGKIMRARKAV